MVRRGSTVRVRQRALQKPRTAATFVSDLLPLLLTWGTYEAPLWGLQIENAALGRPCRPPPPGPSPRDQVKAAPNVELHGDELSRADESTHYHHDQLNYTPPDTQRGRRLARR